MTRRLVAACALVLGCAGAAAAQDDRVLVVPFELDRFDARVGWLGEGVAVGITAALADRGVAVVPRDERLAAFERLQLPATAALTRATLIKVAELVGADRVVLGGVRERDARVTIAPRVLDIARATLIDAAEVTAPAATLVPVFAEIAAAVVPEARAAPGGTPPPPPTPAFESYVRGLLSSTPEMRERLLAQALSLAPRFAPARLALWQAQTARGAHEAALKTATAAPPTDAAWRIRAASSLVQLRRWDEAFSRLTASATDPSAADVPALLGVVQLRRGGTPQTGKATYYFNLAVERDPANADACFNLGYAYWLDKDPMAAAYWLREAVRRDPTDGDAHYVLAAALTATGAGTEAARERELAGRLSERWESAGGVVPRGLERMPDAGVRSPTWLDSVLSAGAERDRRAAAAFQLDAARRAYEAGNDQEAIRAVQRALYSTPYDVEALRLLARAQGRSGLVQEAIATFTIAIWSGESADLHVELGELLLRARDSAGAARAAARALMLAPGHAGALDLAQRAKAAAGA